MKRTPLRRTGGLKRGGSLKRSGKLKPRTAKRKSADAEYSQLRREFLTSGTVCEHRFECCTGRATDVDHRIPRGLAPHRINDSTNWVRSCRACHVWRHDKLSREQRQELKLGIYADDYDG